MTIDEATTFFVTQTVVGLIIDRGKSSVSIYKKKGGIPFNHQCILEKASNGKLKANREDDPDNIFYSPNFSLVKAS